MIKIATYMKRNKNAMGLQKKVHCVFSEYEFCSCLSAAAAEEKNSYDNEPDNVVVIKNIAKAVVIHKSSSKNF